MTTVIPGSPRSKLASVFKPPAYAQVPEHTLPGAIVSKPSLSARAQTSIGSSRATLPRNLEGQNRIQHYRQRSQLKSIMQTVSASNGEMNTSDLLLSAKLAKIQLPQEFLLKTPYANKYAAGWDEAASSPRSIKWRPFFDAIDYDKVQPASTEAFLKQHADREARRAAAEAASAQAAADAAAIAAAAPAAAAAAAVDTRPFVSDEELRKSHTMIKSRLSSQFPELRHAFRSVDKDGSGTISHEEAQQTLMALNLGLPQHVISRIVDLADYDGDGDINFAEFARVLSADDVMQMKDSIQASYKGGVVQGRTVGKSIKKAKKMFTDTVSEDDVKSAVLTIREKLLIKYKGLGSAFQAIDEDRSGNLSHDEFRFLLKMTNLELIHDNVIDAIILLMDNDGSQNINHNEFVTVLSAQNPCSHAPVAKEFQKYGL